MRRRLALAANVASICVALVAVGMMALGAAEPSKRSFDWYPVARGYTLIVTSNRAGAIALDRPLDVPAIDQMSPTQRHAWFSAREPRGIDWGGFRLFVGEVVIYGMNIKHYDFRIEFGLPLWIVVVAACALPTLTIASAAYKRRLAADTRCPKCGYDLRVTPDRCPECGREVAPRGA